MSLTIQPTDTRAAPAVETGKFVKNTLVGGAYAAVRAGLINHLLAGTGYSILQGKVSKWEMPLVVLGACSMVPEIVEKVDAVIAEKTGCDLNKIKLAGTIGMLTGLVSRMRTSYSCYDSSTYVNFYTFSPEFHDCVLTSRADTILAFSTNAAILSGALSASLALLKV